MTNNLETAAKRVRAEFARFREALPALLQEHRGQWVVFHGGQVAAFFPDEQVAYDHAVSTLGAQSGFVVAQVREITPQPINAAAAFLV